MKVYLLKRVELLPQCFQIPAAAEVQKASLYDKQFNNNHCYSCLPIIYISVHYPVDGSVSTLWDNDYWKSLPEFSNLTEPLYTNPDYIHHLNPNTKFIVILRNPVDR